jgi:putative ABC transport system permease protein
MPLSKLVTSNLATRKVRTALTIAAIALSVSLVVAVTSGYKSAEGAIYKYLITYMGATDVQITHKNDFRQGVAETLIDQLRRDPDVKTAVGRLETDTGMIDAQGKPIPGRAAQLIGVDRPTDVDITRSPTDEGKWFDTNTGNVVVIDQQAAEALKVKVGDSIFLPTADEKRAFKVVGICHKPAILAEKTSWIYLPLRTAQELTQHQGLVTRIMIQLKPGVDDKPFADRWDPQLKAINPDLTLRMARDTRKEMDKNLSVVHFMSYQAGAVSMVAAVFVVLSTLLMGVTERQRTLAMLRAIGAYRLQVAKLVIIESAYLGVAGAAAGVAGGVFWVWALVKWKSTFFTAGLFVDWAGVAVGVATAIGATLVACIIPAWFASHVSPLEAMSPHAKQPSLRTPLLCAILGVAMISIDSVIIFSDLPKELKFYGHYILGLPGMVVGFFLLAPTFVWIVENTCARAAALIVGIEPHLLRQQLSGGIWRAASTGAALMIGLAVLVVMQTLGHSMLSGWRLPDKFPDIFIYAGQGLDETQWKKLGEIDGIRKDEVLPIAIAFPGLPEGIFGVIGAAVLPDATMFLGVEPDRALKMMELEFRDGNAKDAAAGLKLGDHVIVTEEFRVLKGLKVGDKLPLMTKTGMKDFTICGVVWSPGIDVMVSMFDMGRMFDQRTAASVFGSIDDAKKHFGKDKAFLFAANLEPGIDKEVMLKKVKEQLGEKGWKAGDIRHIKFEIIKGFERLLLMLTTVAFSAMAVAALGVTNTVMASVRSRQWQFGILRSIGVTRGQLVRLVLAEALLLGLVGCLLGVTMGFLLTVNAMGLIRFLLGVVTEITPPWRMIGIGAGIILAVSLLASLWPAVSVARAQPLTLLQSGRASI